MQLFLADATEPTAQEREQALLKPLYRPTCPTCGAVYVVRILRSGGRKRAFLVCEECGEYGEI